LSTKVEHHRPIALGLTENLGQFTLLVLVNAFVGGMVGLERTVLPLIAEREFGIASKSAILSFIVSFGLVKAFVNLFAGRFSERSGRKKLLVTGWRSSCSLHDHVGSVMEHDHFCERFAGD
jgi:MFS family permease